MEEEQFVFNRPHHATTCHNGENSTDDHHNSNQSNLSFYENTDYIDYSFEQEHNHNDNETEAATSTLPTSTAVNINSNENQTSKLRCFSESEILDHHHEQNHQYCSMPLASFTNHNEQLIRQRSYTADAARTLTQSDQQQQLRRRTSINHIFNQNKSDTSLIVSSVSASSSSTELVQFLLSNDTPNISYDLSDDGNDQNFHSIPQQLRSIDALSNPVQQQPSGQQIMAEVSNRYDNRVIRERNQAYPHHNTTAITHATNNASDPEDIARIRYLQINRRFQYIIAFVVVQFSVLLFALFITWIIFTSKVIFSYDDRCENYVDDENDIRSYYYLSTIQLLITIFRTNIVRFISCWDDRFTERNNNSFHQNRQQNSPATVSSNAEGTSMSSNSSAVIPGRVIVFNIIYFVYAIMVLRMGLMCVLASQTTSTDNDESLSSDCRFTTTELYRTSVTFVALSILAWTTIIVGYVVPFCVVAVMLTLNGYNPSTSSFNVNHTLSSFPFLPTTYNYPTSFGAPSDCIDQLQIVNTNSFSTSPIPDDEISISTTPMECCICMEYMNLNHTADHDTNSNDGNDDLLVMIPICQHIFHKSCCKEWLCHSRTCPVCRNDIPTSLQQRDVGGRVKHRTNTSDVERG